MGSGISFFRALTIAAAGWVLAASAGCQTSSPVSSSRLIEHQAMIDFSGLNDAKVFSPVKASCAPPQDWERMNLQRGALYTHQLWRSPSRSTGVGIAYVRLPLPLSTNLLLWAAQREYTKKSSDGKLIRTWKDSLGRSWFEAENARYHVRGYAVVNGLDAWFAYCGYKINQPMNPAEIALSARSLESVVPLKSAADAKLAMRSPSSSTGEKK